jgi:D-threonate/D-erythronate kinase
LRIGVLADDLTGAFDTGVQFRNWGLSVEVLIGDVKDASKLTSDVVVVDTESRLIHKEDAYWRVYHSTEKLLEFGVDRFYKKVDSTLRGNIGAELDAAMEASKAGFAVLAPAYPTYGRTTLSGKQLIDNNPLEKTEYVDELSAKTSEIAAIIGAQSKRKVGLVPFDAVEAGVNSIKAKIEALKKDAVEIAVFDAITEKHLIDISRSIGDSKLLVGSAGLASEIPIGLGLRSIKPILSVCGSTRRLSRTQIRNLHDRLGFKEVGIGINQLIDGEAEVKAEVKRCVDEAVEALKAGVDVSITSSPKEASAEEFIAHARDRGIKETEAKLFIEEAMGEIASAILAEADVLGLLLTGGATGLMVCQKLGADRASIVEEIEPGIPLLTLSNGIPAVTKAGGFGVDDSLVQAVQRLRRRMAK